MIKEIVGTYLLSKLLGKERTRKFGIWAQQYTIYLAVYILAFISIAQSIRFAYGATLVIAGWSVPLWVSAIVAVVTGYVAFGLWKLL